MDLSFDAWTKRGRLTPQKIKEVIKARGEKATKTLYDQGRAAIRNKDWKTAHSKLVPLVKLATSNSSKYDALAAYDLGTMYLNGHGVEKNLPKAIEFYTNSAKRGFSGAQYNLGVMHKHGLGVPQDNKTAVKWYRLAAKQGHAKSQHNLGVMYTSGHGVPQNYKTALRWYRLAAEQGHAGSQSNLGVMYAEGQGVIQDNVYAYMWWDIAASSGNKNASKYRDIVVKRMTSNQIEKAQDLTHECVRKKYKRY